MKLPEAILLGSAVSRSRRRERVSMSLQRQMFEDEAYIPAITLDNLFQRALYLFTIRALEIREFHHRHSWICGSFGRRDSIVQLRNKNGRRKVDTNGPLLSQSFEPHTIVFHPRLIFQVHSQTLTRFVRTHRREE